MELECSGEAWVGDPPTEEIHGSYTLSLRPQFGGW